MSIQQIDLFLHNYNEMLNHPSFNHNNKLHVYAEYLKHKKYYMQNNIDDTMLARAYGLSKSDMVDLDNVIEHLEYGNKLYKPERKLDTNIQGNDIQSTFYNYNEDDEIKNTGFELLNEVASAMDSYHKKMKTIKSKEYGRMRIPQDDENNNYKENYQVPKEEHRIPRRRYNSAVYNRDYEEQQYNLDHQTIPTNLLELPNNRFNETVSLTAYTYPNYQDRTSSQSSRRDNKDFRY